MYEAIIRVAADGSAGSRRALTWALTEAELRHCAVEVVGVYPLTEPDVSAAKRAAAEAVHATMDDIVAGRADVPTVSWRITGGDPADVLSRESGHSQLIVMGSHDVSGLLHSAAGSIVDICSRTANCPVVIVPAPCPTSDAGNLVELEANYEHNQ
jgi:nucleotide-binding universal stress UspA family protein